VNRVLAEIGAEQVPQLLVLNKIDLLPAAEATVRVDACGKINELRVSAITGQGLDHLRAAIADRFSGDNRSPANAPWLSESAQVLS
jgi:GTPase